MSAFFFLNLVLFNNLNILDIFYTIVSPEISPQTVPLL